MRCAGKVTQKINIMDMYVSAFGINVENYFLLDTMYNRPSDLPLNSGAELKSEWTKT